MTEAHACFTHQEAKKRQVDKRWKLVLGLQCRPGQLAGAIGGSAARNGSGAGGSGLRPKRKSEQASALGGNVGAGLSGQDAHPETTAAQQPAQQPNSLPANGSKPAPRVASLRETRGMIAASATPVVAAATATPVVAAATAKPRRNSNKQPHSKQPNRAGGCRQASARPRDEGGDDEGEGPAKRTQPEGRAKRPLRAAASAQNAVPPAPTSLMGRGSSRGHPGESAPGGQPAHRASSAGAGGSAAGGSRRAKALPPFRGGFGA